MKQHFVESAVQPQLFVFTQSLVYDESDVDFSKFVCKFERDFSEKQEKNWYEYWTQYGENYVLEQWQLKYKEFLADTSISTDVADVEANTEETLKIETPTTVEQVTDINHDSSGWEELWQQHSEAIYYEQYILYTSIYYNYFLDLKKSLETKIESPTALEEDAEDHIEGDAHDHIVSELEQLQLLGLPTAFGGRPLANSKKHTKNNDYANSSAFFSDNEEELEDSDSEMDPSSPSSNVEDEISLHQGDNIKLPKDRNKKKKRNRKLRKVPSFIQEDKTLLKYWRKRFSLFSRFDEGIRLDRESWFSVTPEKVAAHLADRLSCDILIDGFCGSGGNTIQFAKTCRQVIAIDIDPQKIEMAKHNATIYGVADKIEFIVGDFFQLSSRLRGDVVFLSPPWGGPKYKNKQDYDVEKFLLPVGASELVDQARKISNNVALFLPRNSNMQQIIKIAGIGNRCEVEHNYLDTRLVAITALYGDDILRKE